MELECRQETVTRWDAVSRLEVEREENGEMIVPDACPDIGAVLVTHPRLFLQRKEVQEGRAEFSGLIRVGILYRPEGEEGIASMEAVLPFNAAAEDPALTSACVLWTTPRILSVDIHPLNSRKVLAKVVFCLEVTAWAPEQETFLAMVEDPLPWGIRQKIGSIQSFCPTNVQEKSFTVRDTLTVPAGQPDPKEILTSEAGCRCEEARVVGDKLLFKGETRLDLLCRDGEGELYSLRFQLPFSQIMDGESDGDICQVEGFVSDLSCTQDPEDPRSIQVEFTVQAQGEVFRTAETAALTDVYSVSYQLETDREEIPAPQLLDRNESRESARIVLSSMTGSCEDLRVRLGRGSTRREGDSILLDQEVTATAICYGADGPTGTEKTETVTQRVPNSGTALCQWSAGLSQDPAAQPVADGIEVTVPLTFRWILTEDRTCPVIRQVSLGEKQERGETVPSLVIRPAKEGQTLWDIAKANASTQEEIMAASGLADEELYPGQMLLIPRNGG